MRVHLAHRRIERDVNRFTLNHILRDDRPGYRGDAEYIDSRRARGCRIECVLSIARDEVSNDDMLSFMFTGGAGEGSGSMIVCIVTPGRPLSRSTLLITTLPAAVVPGKGAEVFPRLRQHRALGNHYA